MSHIYKWYISVNKNVSAMNTVTLDERKTNRIVLSLSELELTEIDNWRFEQRIVSRNEAIRQLVRRGLTSGRPSNN